MLDAREAADYCGIVPKRFPAECNVTPVSMPNGQRRYDMRDLDTWLDSLKSGDASSDDDLVGKLG
ncbi:hypothetical protein EN851_27175 [Mesorhizobium sp. M8A.F.Ca.ET.208.01.1.1]|nr:hypothetical protein EN861_01430 [Mesorhizobium sp. M8A.F.Ca.ET.218.01.1.1]TGQ87873.1 hypothetical protein EN851_27175 [Mesorhizobium sp. M8A.F.Ca.ET.208.01.1.1]TGT21597.1 hypothetical protein EN856_01430 [Mesorhizobium sp. M8A.F.Ca.ET.213.01.1.1]TGT49603.1 hypothetical protein EN810_27075 [Mesorhizobium sp. M8A.F.Ca.ET.167.01.1.1]